MKKTLNLIGLLVVLAIILTACPAPGASSAALEAIEPAQEATDSGNSSGEAKIALEFWHAMGRNLGELVDELTARFNASQDRD